MNGAWFLTGNEFLNQVVEVANMVVGIRSVQHDAGFFSVLIQEEYPRDGNDAAQCKDIVPDTEAPLCAAFIFAHCVEVLTVPPHLRSLCPSNNLGFDQVDEHLARASASILKLAIPASGKNQSILAGLLAST
jgi:hypothetical protein